MVVDVAAAHDATHDVEGRDAVHDVVGRDALALRDVVARDSMHRDVVDLQRRACSALRCLYSLQGSNL